MSNDLLVLAMVTRRLKRSAARVFNLKAGTVRSQLAYGNGPGTEQFGAVTEANTHVKINAEYTQPDLKILPSSPGIICKPTCV